MTGTWYNSELLPLEMDLDEMSFQIDKILKRRGKEKKQRSTSFLEKLPQEIQSVDTKT